MNKIKLKINKVPILIKAANCLFSVEEKSQVEPNLL